MADKIEAAVGMRCLFSTEVNGKPQEGKVLRFSESGSYVQVKGPERTEWFAKNHFNVLEVVAEDGVKPKAKETAPEAPKEPAKPEGDKK